MAPSSLPTLLNVLDYADAARQRREEAQAQAPARHLLLDAVQHLDTEHEAADLAQGVDSYLAVVSHTVGKATNETGPFDFGWLRPTTAQEQAELKRRADKRRKWEKITEDDTFQTLAGVLILSLGMCGVAGLAGAGVELGRLLSQAAHGYLDLHKSMVTGGLSGVMSATFLISWLEGGALKKRRARATDACSPEMGEWFTGDLLHLDMDYLNYATTRAYLRAVMSSPLPQLMRGDVDRLDALYNQADAGAAAERRRLEKMAAEKIKQDRAQSRLHRMTDFAQALTAYQE